MSCTGGDGEGPCTKEGGLGSCKRDRAGALQRDLPVKRMTDIQT